MSAKPIAPPNPFRKARRAGVPIVGIESADPAATINKCGAALNGDHNDTPQIKWDIVRGPSPINQAGGAVMVNLEGGEMLKQPDKFLEEIAAKADCLYFVTEEEREAHPEVADQKKHSAIFYLIHANRFMDDTVFMQALWNCRDRLKPHGVCVVLIGPSIKLPAELKNDAVLISEPLPDHAELSRILDSITGDAGFKPGQITDREIIVDIMTGTSAFGAEQILSMSLVKEGVDQDQLWDRKRKMIEQTPGLAVWRGGSRFEDLGGLSNLKEFLTRVLTSGSTPCRCIGFIDEIEKGLAGATGDLSGTSQDQLQVFLKVMQDYNIPGIILVGHAGTGKSEIAKAAGNVARCPVISIDTGAMKDSLVGGSEARIRAAMDVFKAVSQGKGLFIATCNRISSLPPELRRRFTLGTFFVDLPDDKEQKSIWPIWMKRYNLEKQDLPDTTDWTGAEIRACCDVAFRTGLSLREAARFVVPIIKSAPEAVEGLRQLANNRFISASRAGVYQYQPKDLPAAATGRKIQV